MVNCDAERRCTYRLLAATQNEYEQVDLTACINWMVCEFQLPHKIVISMFTLTKSMQQVDDFVGELTFPNHLNTLCAIKVSSDSWKCIFWNPVTRLTTQMCPASDVTAFVW